MRLVEPTHQPPSFSPADCDRLREVFQRCGFDTDGVLAALGGQAHAALSRDEPEPARRASRDAGDLGTLIRLFLLGDTEPVTEVERVFAPLGVDRAVQLEVLERSGNGLRAGLDIRPHGDDEHSWWVISDVDQVQRGRNRSTRVDHVVGVGQASLSLVRATSRRPVGSVLDVGAGNGVQTLYASTHAERLTATDVSPRAVALAEATFRLNQLEVEVLRGAWFEPVSGREFDQIVCNPPFVVGPPTVDYTYRDSGLGGDAASELVVRSLPRHLSPGGTGHLLASWLHREGEDWAERVSSWLPGGVDAWFVQRDVADPALYVGTWLRDAGIDPRSPEGSRKASAWLDFFESQRVEGVGFGFVTLRRTDGEATVVCEDLRQAYDDPLGPEAAAWLDRVQWLRDHPDLLTERLRVADSVVLETISQPGDEGWSEQIRRLHRMDGPGWQHDIDELAAALIAGCRGLLPLGDLVALLAHAFDEQPQQLATGVRTMARQLVLHGMLEPATEDAE
jgi:methylase of polypeptide subunit release factors